MVSHDHPALERLSPDVAGLVEEIAAQPGSLLLQYQMPPVPDEFVPGRAPRSAWEPFLSKAERHLLRVHREELGVTLHRASAAHIHAAREESDAMLDPYQLRKRFSASRFRRMLRGIQDQTAGSGPYSRPPGGLRALLTAPPSLQSAVALSRIAQGLYPHACAAINFAFACQRAGRVGASTEVLCHLDEIGLGVENRCLRAINLGVNSMYLERYQDAIAHLSEVGREDPTGRTELLLLVVGLFMQSHAHTKSALRRLRGFESERDQLTSWLRVVQLVNGTSKWPDRLKASSIDVAVRSPRLAEELYVWIQSPPPDLHA